MILFYQDFNTGRTLIYSKVDNDEIDARMSSLSAIGIRTTMDYTTAKLEIDEEKLRQAIEQDPDSIERLFRSPGETTAQKGIIQRLYDLANSAMKRLGDRAGNAYSVNHTFTLGRQINRLQDRIERFERRLVDLETRYYAQFTRMEKAIQRANSQSMYLMQFFS